MILSADKKMAFETVYNKYSNMLYRLALSILLNGEDAEDAVQTVFINYLTKQPFFNSEEHEKAWFLRVTINQSKDSLRKRKVRAALPLDDVTDVGVYDEQYSVLTLLSALPEKYKTAVTLHYLEGFSVEETAEILKISKSAVKMRLSRGRDILKKKL